MGLTWILFFSLVVINYDQKFSSKQSLNAHFHTTFCLHPFYKLFQTTFLFQSRNSRNRNVMGANSNFTEMKCYHLHGIFITGCTWSFNFDNFMCSQWRKFLIFFFSVLHEAIISLPQFQWSRFSYSRNWVNLHSTPQIRHSLPKFTILQGVHWHTNPTGSDSGLTQWILWGKQESISGYIRFIMINGHEWSHLEYHLRSAEGKKGKKDTVKSCFKLQHSNCSPK